RSHDRFDEIEWAKRLGEERIGAGAESLVARARRALRSEYDDASGTERRIGAQRAAHLIPIQTGHHHIKDDDVGRPDRGDGERVLSVHRFVEVEAGVVQYRSKEIADQRVVIDHEYPHAVFL